MGIITVLWEKWVEFRRDFYKITLAAMISPLMYLMIFGFGIQTTSHGEPYLMFLIPGIVAMSTMTGSFGAVAQNMIVQRLYEKALGQIIGGALRGMYAGLVILILTLPVRGGLIFNGWSFLVMFLHGTVFSTIALVLSFLSKSHSVTPRYNAYIITPMSFLCNTFFSTDQMPGVFRTVVSALPLSQASRMIRAISRGEDPGRAGFFVLLLYLVIFGGISFFYIYRKKTL